jgi:uncharacterized protein YjbJ (UPF0337 family)
MKVKGREQQVKGKVKEAAGLVTGNDRMKADGRADVSEGKARAAVGDASQKVKKFAKRIVGN